MEKPSTNHVAASECRATFAASLIRHTHKQEPHKGGTWKRFVNSGRVLVKGTPSTLLEEKEFLRDRIGTDYSIISTPMRVGNSKATLHCSLERSWENTYAPSANGLREDVEDNG